MMRRDDFYIEVPCGRCINFVTSYMTKWRTRLFHEWEYMSSEARRNSFFVTLTFSDKYLKSPDFDVYTCKYRFIDRLRKKHGSTPRYWMITEYGERKGRLHLHGLFFDVQFPIHELEDLWQYGIVDYSYMSSDCIKYCTSYITKGNDDIIVPKSKVQRVFCSPGIGKAYTEDSYNIRYARLPLSAIPSLKTKSVRTRIAVIITASNNIRFFFVNNLSILSSLTCF